MRNECTANEEIIPEIELSYKPLRMLSSLPIVTTTEHAYALFLRCWDTRKIQFVERLKVMLLSRSCNVLGICSISTGSAKGTVADPKLIFAAAIKVMHKVSFLLTIALVSVQRSEHNKLITSQLK